MVMPGLMMNRMPTDPEPSEPLTFQPPMSTEIGCGLYSSINSSLPPFGPLVRNSLITRRVGAGPGVLVGVRVRVLVLVGVRVGRGVNVLVGVEVGMHILETNPSRVNAGGAWTGWKGLTRGKFCDSVWPDT